MATTISKRTPRWAWGCTNQLSEQDVANLRRLNVWSIGWALSFVAGIAVLRFWGEGWSLPLRVATALAPSLVGLQVGRVFLRFLRATDELQRRIHLEGLAIGFGCGALFMLGYRLLERAGAPSQDVSTPFVVMCVAYGLGVWFGRRRYS